MPPNRFESEVESFLEGSHGDRTHIKRADHPRLHHYAGRYSGTPQTDVFGPFFVRWANFFALTPTIRPSRANFFAHRTRDMATLKPTTPLQPLMQTNVKPPSPMLAPKQRPLKPPSPLLPKNTPKTPISHPQRRCRFQLRLSLREQRRWRFQLGGSKGDAGFRQPLRAQPRARSSEKLHAIRLGEDSTMPENVAIPTL